MGVRVETAGVTGTAGRMETGADAGEAGRGAAGQKPHGQRAMDSSDGTTLNRKRAQSMMLFRNAIVGCGRQGEAEDRGAGIGAKETASLTIFALWGYITPAEAGGMLGCCGTPIADRPIRTLFPTAGCPRSGLSPAGGK